MKSLSLKAYPQLAAYEVASCYRLTAISKASGILRHYRRSLRKNPKTRAPYVKRLSLTDCYAFKIEGHRLRLTLRAYEYAHIDLNPHTLSMISARPLRSVMLTTQTLSIAYSKDVVEITPGGFVGLDRNLNNVTTADSARVIQRYDLSRATDFKAKCRETKSRFTRNDARTRRAIFGKYGKIQSNRVAWILNNVSSSIVKAAKENEYAIVMEDLKGIRKLYRKGNGQGANYRAKLNSWSYYELQRQIEYKARWDGIPVIYVAARGTSAKCSTCGSKTFPNEDRTLYCPACKTHDDRDVNAARNILAKGVLRFGTDGPSGEAMVEEPEAARRQSSQSMTGRQPSTLLSNEHTPRVVRTKRK
jgi:putative transposase